MARASTKSNSGTTKSPSGDIPADAGVKKTLARKAPAAKASDAPVAKSTAKKAATTKAAPKKAEPKKAAPKPAAKAKTMVNDVKAPVLADTPKPVKKKAPVKKAVETAVGAVAEAGEMAGEKLNDLKTAAAPAMKAAAEKAEAALETAKEKLDDAVEAAKPVIHDAAVKADEVTHDMASKAHEVTGKAEQATRKKPGFWARLFGAK